MTNTHETVLLTGATGNVGAVALEQLIAAGHKVNAVLRNSSKSGPFLSAKFPDAVSSGQLVFTSIPDMTVPGVFHEPAKSATAVMHIATPIGYSNYMETLIKPAWEINENILEAARHSESVRRVVICGSISAAMRIPFDFSVPVTITEANWNDVTLDEALVHPMNAYMYSKRESERKAWLWMEEHKATAGFDLVVLLPPLISGRSPQQGYSPINEHLGGIALVYRALLGEKVEDTFPFFMDVDDVARTHLLSLDRTRVPGNERYIVGAPEILNLKQVANQLRAAHPELRDRIAAVQVNEEEKGPTTKLSTAKADKVFGTDWTGALASIGAIVWDVVNWEKAQKEKEQE